ncbi:IclR family transcriptional regulator domain-containing protein [Rhodococcus opacus]|uniref:IclR family transcriptional regulator domain-containing protein n=1 Tax=Rhodococcus opacus TaxID=37919 RepID=UPI003AF3235F
MHRALRSGQEFSSTGRLPRPPWRVLISAATEHDLAEATDENVQMMVLDGLDALCIEKISASTAVPSATEVDGRLPLHWTAADKCILANSAIELLVEIVDPRDEARPPTRSSRLRTSRGSPNRCRPLPRGDGSRRDLSGIANHGARRLPEGCPWVVARWPGQLEHLRSCCPRHCADISRGCR